MNKNELKHMIDLIDDQSILDAAATEVVVIKNRKPAWQKITIAAAAVCLVAFSIYMLKPLLNNYRLPAASSVTVSSTQQATSIIETAIVPKWDDLAIHEKYLSGAIIGGTEFQAGVSQLDSSQIGDKIGQLELSGFDIYNEVRYTIDAEYYSVANIDPECVIAVRYDGYEGYYSFYNSWYEFSTLAEMIGKLDLERSMIINNTFYQYYFTDNDPVNGQYRINVYKLPDTISYKEDLRKMLFADTNLENLTEISNEQLGWEKLGISIDYPPAGQTNIGISLFENGYMGTNILGTLKIYHIGETRVNQIVNYIQTEGILDQTIGHDAPEETGDTSEDKDETVSSEAVVVETTAS